MFLTILINFLLAINIFVCALIILLVLMQRPKSEGLGAAFGGGMTENLFGAQTTTVLTNITRWLGGIFFALTLILSILYSQQAKRLVKGGNLQELLKSTTPSSETAAAKPAEPPVQPAKSEAPVAKTESPAAAPVVKTEAPAPVVKSEAPAASTAPAVNGTSNP